MEEGDGEVGNLVQNRRIYLCGYTPPTRPTDFIDPMTGEKQVAQIVDSVSILSACLCSTDTILFLYIFFFRGVLASLHVLCCSLTDVIRHRILRTSRFWQVVFDWEHIESDIRMARFPRDSSAKSPSRTDGRHSVVSSADRRR